jgi:hypothetical protein
MHKHCKLFREWYSVKQAPTGFRSRVAKIRKRKEETLHDQLWLTWQVYSPASDSSARLMAKLLPSGRTST